MNINEYLTKLKNEENFRPKKILDIGANIGEFAKFCKLLFVDTKILMIEANQYCEEDLISTGFEYEIILLGKEKKEVDFFINPSNRKCTGCSYYKEITSHYKDCVVEKKKINLLDEFTSEKFNLIKIDTQGSELDIIKGGMGVIKNCEILIVESSVREFNKNAPNFSELVDFLHDIGFYQYEIIESHIWSSESPEFESGEVFQLDIAFKNSKK